MEKFFHLEDLDGNYLISERNFGTIRYGDLVAIATVARSIKRQFPNIKLYIEIPPYVHDLIDCLVFNFDGYFLKKRLPQHLNMKNFPLHGNVWSYYTYLYKNFNLNPLFSIDHIVKNPNITNKFENLKKIIEFYRKKYNSKCILLIPLFKTRHNDYNQDRFFPFSFTYNLINQFININQEYFVILAGSKYNNDYIRFKNQIKIKPGNLYIVECSNIMESIYLMSMLDQNRDYYIGGDTGLSHIAAINPKGINNLIFLYGKHSKDRHTKDYEKVARKYAIIKKHIFNDYSPKPIKGKKIYYFDEGFNETVLKEVRKLIN